MYHLWKTFVIVVGRILFAALFLIAAPRHFTVEGAHHAADLGLPWAGFLVPLYGLICIAGGLLVATGYRSRLGAALLCIFLVPVTFTMHAFWKRTEQREVDVQRAMFAKNFALLGAALVLTQLDVGVRMRQGKLH